MKTPSRPFGSFGPIAAVGTLVSLMSFVAAADVPVCLNTQSQWTYNTLGQSPCEMASYLEGVCSTTGLNVDIPPLLDGEYYIAGRPQYTNPCRCNTVVYSLLSACAICQGTGTFREWSEYSLNCTSSMTSLGSFPASIPSGTRIPHWAYLDVTTLDIFSATLAQDSLSAPESTPVRQATSTSFRSGTTGLPGYTPTPIPTQASGSKKSNAGAIAGGVIGGVVFLAILGGLFWLVRRRQKTLGRPVSGVSTVGTGAGAGAGGGGGSVGGPQTVQYNPNGLYPVPSPSLQKPYDPSDPLTFPTPSPVPYSPVTLPYSTSTNTPPPPTPPVASVGNLGVQAPPGPPNRFSTAGQGHGYSGAPEV